MFEGQLINLSLQKMWQERQASISRKPSPRQLFVAALKAPLTESILLLQDNRSINFQSGIAFIKTEHFNKLFYKYTFFLSYEVLILLGQMQFNTDTIILSNMKNLTKQVIRLIGLFQQYRKTRVMWARFPPIDMLF